MMRTFEDLREIVMKEIDEINKRGELDENTLHCVYKLVDIVKDIDEIELGEESKMALAEGAVPITPQLAAAAYAMDGNSYRGGGRNSNASYNSYANRNRDSMGRYSREYGNSYRRGYSRDEGEGEREEIMAKMGHMMDMASSETERQTIRKIMNQL